MQQQTFDSRHATAAAAAAEAAKPAAKQLIKLKILLVGGVATGKTSIVRRYTEQYFTNSYRLTIGTDFASKTISWDKRTTIRLNLWDIAGQERVGCMTRAFYNDADGYAIIYDLTRPETFDDVLRWKTDVDSSVRLNGAPLPCVLLGNKCDLKTDPASFLTPAEMKSFCEDNSIAAWFETSAKTSANIEEAFRLLIAKVMHAISRVKPQRPAPADGRVYGPANNDTQSTGCHC